MLLLRRDIHEVTSLYFSCGQTLRWLILPEIFGRGPRVYCAWVRNAKPCCSGVPRGMYQ